MPRDDLENAEQLHEDIAPWQRGEMAVVADPDAWEDSVDDDELPDTVPETRPLGARVHDSSERHHENAGR